MKHEEKVINPTELAIKIGKALGKTIRPQEQNQNNSTRETQKSELLKAFEKEQKEK